MPSIYPAGTRFYKNALLVSLKMNVVRVEKHLTGRKMFEEVKRKSCVILRKKRQRQDDRCSSRCRMNVVIHHHYY